MELSKHSTIIIIFLIFLLTTPCFVRAGRVISETVDSTTEVYEIDYRGPETHSSIPPPGHFHGNKKALHDLLHKESATVMGTPKAKSARGGNYKRKAKKIHV